MHIKWKHIKMKKRLHFPEHTIKPLYFENFENKRALKNNTPSALLPLPTSCFPGPLAHLQSSSLSNSPSLHSKPDPLHRYVPPTPRSRIPSSETATVPVVFRAILCLRKPIYISLILFTHKVSCCTFHNLPFTLFIMSRRA